MRAEYDFSNAKKNPYVKKEKKQITINLDCKIIEFFKQKSTSSGIPYQVLINMYLNDCVEKNRELVLDWK